jgi:Kdo2-lipid IVA lauroyltransferase/acyltransferase
MTKSGALAHRVRRHLKAGVDTALGSLAVGMLRTIRATNRKHMADFAGSFMRMLGPRLKEHKIGRANLAAAFPEKSPAEIETILRGVWDNLGRVAAEFAHIDRLQMFDPDPQQMGDIIYSSEVDKRFRQLRCDGKPALVFAAHLANWELPALIAAKYRLETTVLYRQPNIAAVSDAIIQIR